MTRSLFFLAVSCVIFLVVVRVTPVAAQDSIWATSAATLSEDPGFEGYWKYCFDVHWDLSECSHGLSHFPVDLALQSCPCVCEEGYIAFADTIGFGPGVDGCTVYYHGSFLCDGDPTIFGMDGPTFKSEYFEGGCEPDVVGSALVCFYSIAPPTEEQTFENGIAAKAGQCEPVWGDVIGVLPSCDCDSTPTKPCTWGAIKAKYGE